MRRLTPDSVVAIVTETLALVSRPRLSRSHAVMVWAPLVSPETVTLLKRPSVPIVNARFWQSDGNAELWSTTMQNVSTPAGADACPLAAARSGDCSVEPFAGAVRLTVGAAGTGGAADVPSSNESESITAGSGWVWSPWPVSLPT